MGVVDCKAKGVFGEPNLYEGKEVVVIYHSATLGWIAEEGIVSSGQVEIPGPGPLTDERYYIGLKYDSIVKTFPIRSQGKMNAKARLSEVSLFLADAGGEGTVEVGGSQRAPVSKKISYPSDFTEGRYDVNIGTPYEEEPYIKITATGLRDFKLLALDADYRQYQTER